jgi:hypothetical protein
MPTALPIPEPRLTLRQTVWCFVLLARERWLDRRLHVSHRHSGLRKRRRARRNGQSRSLASAVTTKTAMTVKIARTELNTRQTLRGSMPIL